jgi:hypothetical protein
MDRYKWSESRPGHFYPGKEPTEWKAGWAALTAGLDRFGEKIILLSPRFEVQTFQPAA